MNRYSWLFASKKISQKSRFPNSVGDFDEAEAIERKMRLATGREGALSEDAVLQLSILVDETDGIITDAKFRAFGPTLLIGIAEATCEILLRKNYEQARRLSADLIEKSLRDKPSVQSIPEDAYPLLNLALSAIDYATSKCYDIPIDDLISPLPEDFLEEGMYPEYETLAKEQKIQLVEKVIEEDIRPYIELDAGGIEILDLQENILTIRYQGACTTCPSSTGTTLGAIQGILQNKLSKNLEVKPDFIAAGSE